MRPSIVPLASLVLSGLGIAACEARISVGDLPPTGDGPAPAAPASVATTATEAEPDWEWLNPKPAAHDFRAVFGTSANSLWVVGGEGTVLRWDGTKLTSAYQGKPTDTFWTGWAAADDDVWIVGDGDSHGSRVLHYDGHAFAEEFSLSEYRVHAMWGVAKNEVYAAVDRYGESDIAVWDGRTWRFPQQFLVYGGAPILRDIDGLGRKNHWAVGAHGTIAGPWGDHPWELWGLPPDSPTGPVVNPRDPRIDYVAVRATSDHEAWAIFVDECHTPGVAHFDGIQWNVNHEICNQTDPPTAPPRGFGGPLPNGPLRQGKLLAWNGHDLVWAGLQTPPAVAKGGTKWQNVYRDLTRADDMSINAPLGLWSDGAGNVIAGAQYGALYGLEASSTSGWRDLAPSGCRTRLSSVAPVGERAWTVGTPLVWEWDGGSWQPVHIPADQFVANDVAALSETAVWAVGSVPGPMDARGAIAHKDAAGWSVTPLPADSIRQLTGVWARSENDVWVTGAGWLDEDAQPSSERLQTRVVALHGDGQSWTPVPVQDSRHGFPFSLHSARIGGAGDELWLVGSYGVPGDDASNYFLERWNGHGFVEVSREQGWQTNGTITAGGATRPWVGGATNVWIPDRPAFRFDGQSFVHPFSSSDFSSIGIGGLRGDDLWLAGASAQGGAVRHWDGASLTTAVSTTAPMLDVRVAPSGDTWAVGEGGATLRKRARANPATTVSNGGAP